MKNLGKLLAILALFSLVGCSSTTFMYNRLDFIIPWYLGDYVDLERDQRQQLDELLVPFLQWHRQDELPQYLELLDSMIADLDQPATAESVAATTRAIEQAWFRIEARAVLWMIELGEGLSDDQLDEFIATLRKDQEKFRKKYLERDDEEYHEDAYDNFLDSAQDFMGRLDWGQRTILQEATSRMIRSDSVWLEEREAWIDRLEDTLQREEGWQQRILDDLAERDQTVSPEYNEALEHNLALIHQAVADLVNSRTERQDRRLRKELEGFREDVLTLMEQEG